MKRHMIRDGEGRVVLILAESRERAEAVARGDDAR